MQGKFLYFDELSFIIFLELLIDALFKPSSRVNPEHKPKYVFVLSYAASVTEVYKKVS